MKSKQLNKALDYFYSLVKSGLDRGFAIHKTCSDLNLDKTTFLKELQTRRWHR